MRVALTFSVFRVELVESKGNHEVSIRMPETINAIPHMSSLFWQQHGVRVVLRRALTQSSLTLIINNINTKSI